MGDTPRVLIVEDTRTLLEALAIAFRARGWEAALAMNVDDAVAALATSPPDVILTDKNLPGGKSGVDLIRQVRAADDAVGIVLMTAYASVESARDTLNIGIDEYLEKPFANVFAVVDTLDELRARVLERRQAAANALAAATALTIIVAATGGRRDRLARELGGAHDRVLFVDEEALRPSAKSEHADVAILDGASFPEEITCLAATVRTRAPTAACIVLSEALSLADVKRLIQLQVRALIELPLESHAFAPALAAALERIRRRVRNG